MKPDAVPVAQKPRPVPYYLQDPLMKWLDQCREEDIFERVEGDEPITWCSPLVVQPKPRIYDVEKEKVETHMIRARVDLRIANRSMERNRILRAPIVAELIDKCVNCQITTKELRKEVMKPSDIPVEHLDTVYVDFGGPFPDGQYNLIVIDKHTKWPDVEQVYSTSFRSTVKENVLNTRSS